MKSFVFCLQMATISNVGEQAGLVDFVNKGIYLCISVKIVRCQLYIIYDF